MKKENWLYMWNIPFSFIICVKSATNPITVYIYRTNNKQ